MFELKPISGASVGAALQKAERYRLLNEPSAAESICLDVLAADPDNQQATILLLLSITDQFGDQPAAGVSRALEVLPQIEDEYKRAYYHGIICERRAKAHLRQTHPGAAEIAYHWFRQAMSWYEQAEASRPPGNDEALLRWNTCARLVDRDEHVRPRPPEDFAPSLEE